MKLVYIIKNFCCLKHISGIGNILQEFIDNSSWDISLFIKLSSDSSFSDMPSSTYADMYEYIHAQQSECYISLMQQMSSLIYEVDKVILDPKNRKTSYDCLYCSVTKAPLSTATSGLCKLDEAALTGKVCCKCDACNTYKKSIVAQMRRQHEATPEMVLERATCALSSQRPH